MGGKFIRLRVGDDEYEMPEDEAFQAMEGLEKAGHPFDAQDAPEQRGEVTVGEPEVIKTAPSPHAWTLDTQAAKDADAAADSPYLRALAGDFGALGQLGVQTAGNYAGGALAATGGGGAAVKGFLPTAARVGGEAIRQGAAAGLQSAGQSYADDGDVLKALLSGGKSAAVGAGASLGLGAVGAAASKVGEFAGDWGRKMAGKALGATPGAIDKLRKRGIDVPDGDLVEMADKAGLNNSLLPAGVGEKLKRAQAYGQAGGQMEGEAIREADIARQAEADSLGKRPRNFARDIAADTAEEADGLANGPTAGRSATAGVFDDQTEATSNQDLRTLEKLRQYKTLQDGIRFKDGLAGEREGNLAEAAKFSGNRARHYLDNAMEQSGPELNEQFTQGKRQYGDGQVLQALLAHRSDSLEGNPSAWPMGDIVKEYAPDAFANAGRGLSSMAGGMGGAATAASGAPSAMGGAMAGGAMQQHEQRVRATREGVGSELGSAVSQALEQDPSMLGRFAGPLAEAKKRGTLPGYLFRLQQTDEEWRSTFEPRIKGLTARQR